jgi:hypothetical protein
MIVPPAAVKSPYYGNRILQANWRLASEKIAEGGELIMMGFSLPPTDLLVNSMIAETRFNNKVSFTPVNPDRGVVDRLRNTLRIPAHILCTDFAGIDDPIQEWVDANIR